MNKPSYISIEGNIGSGKSTIMQALKNICYDAELGNTVSFIDEKVSEWTKPFDEKGNSILDLFYSDPKKYSFTFQMQVLNDQLNEITKKTTLNNNVKYVIGERCLNVSKDVFAKMLFNYGKMSRGEWKLFNNIYDRFENSNPLPDMIFYCNKNASVCLENINKRAREGENKIDLEYLLQLEAYHTDFLELYGGSIHNINIPQFTNEAEMNANIYVEAMHILKTIME